MIRYPVARTIKSALAVGAITAASGAVGLHGRYWRLGLSVQF